MTLERNECLEFTKHYIEASREAAKEYDARMFWLAGGAIALSAAFVQRIPEGKQDLLYPALLGVAWLLLLAGIVLVLRSFQVGARLYEQWIQYWMRKMDGDFGDPAPCRTEALRLGKQTDDLNQWALWIILIGLAVLSVFVYANLTLAARRVPSLKTTQTHSTVSESEATGTATPLRLKTIESTVTVIERSEP